MMEWHFGNQRIRLSLYAASGYWGYKFPDYGDSEDCLYLNVWTPAKTGDEKMPVITTNYHVGISGFFAHLELKAKSLLNSSGNYGLLDQGKTLEWVVENIKKFECDPDNITMAGEFARSVSVNALMITRLYRRHSGK